MDLAPVVNGLNQFAVSSQTLVILAITLVGTALIYVSAFGQRLRKMLTETMFTNWRLALLGATGLVLSLASGWTTWDGMRNFTQEPVLSLMITFGIQGVMLIVAWLIGESFATGMNYRPERQSAGGGNNSDGSRSKPAQWGSALPVVGGLIGVLLFIVISVLILNKFGANDAATELSARNNIASLSDNLLFAAFGILLVAAVLLMTVGDIARDYAQAIKIMLRTAVLWVMFLACMATSVFFSFDSLFSTIFPAKERERAAVLRAQNQVAGVVNDIGTLASRRRIQEQDTLFQKDGWKQYEATLDKLVKVAREAPGELEEYFERKMRERQKMVAQRQEEKATAEGQQVRLTQRKGVLVSEIARLKEQVGPLATEAERFKSLVFDKDREIIAKKAAAEAEAGGIGATSKIGRGPKFREIAAELRRLQEQKKNLQLQLDEFEKRLRSTREQIAKFESELASIDGQIAQLSGRAQTAEQLIRMAQQARKTDTPQFDPTNGLRQLERARINFRQNPTKDGLTQIQGLCTTLIAAMTDVPALKSKSRDIDCDPGEASEAAARVFALNVGLQLLAKNCTGGGKLPQTGGADVLFSFARGCVQDAGLPSEDTDRLRTKINYLELNRDDKAHRFVVTSNAFSDGNKLAYLALAIAIAIDALVFMSGLFGANAVRSPLSDVPSHKGRSAQQLEAQIDVALGPHAYDTAKHVLGAMHPITQVDGFTAEIVLHPDDPHATDIRTVLNAGASIGAVRQVEGQPRTYQIRSELFEYLSTVAKREFEKDKSHVNLAQLDRTISVALLPDVGPNAEIVLGYLHPIQERHGFMAELRLDEVDALHIRAVRSALNAGAIYERVQRVDNDPRHFYIHSDFFKTLVGIRGRLLMSGSSRAMIGAAHHHQQGGVVQGGSLTNTPPALAPSTTDEIPATRQLTAAPAPEAHAPSDEPKFELTAAKMPAELSQEERERLREDDQFRARCWSRLVGSVGIDAMDASERLSHEPFVEACRLSWRALSTPAHNRYGRNTQPLSALLAEHETSFSGQIAREFSALRTKFGEDPNKRRIINEVAESLPPYEEALKLFPEAGVLDQIIDELEKAAADGRFEDDEQLLKNEIIRIVDELALLDPVRARSWVELQRRLGDIQLRITPPAHEHRAPDNVVAIKDPNDKPRRSAG